MGPLKLCHNTVLPSCSREMATIFPLLLSSAIMKGEDLEKGSGNVKAVKVCTLILFPLQVLVNETL